jgi:FlaA1/EpsC-like NDP-sugar epimerase
MGHLRNKGKVVNGYPVVGTLESLESILDKNSVSEVILAISEFPKEKLERLSQICSSHQIPLRRFQARLEDIPT